MNRGPAIFSAEAVDDNPTRWVLQELARIARHTQFTEMLKENVEALHWTQEERGYVLTFVMVAKDVEEMRKILPPLFARLKKGIEEGSGEGFTLFNVKAETKENLC